MPSSACFEAAYAPMKGKLVLPATEDICTMRPGLPVRAVSCAEQRCEGLGDHCGADEVDLHLVAEVSQ